MVKKYDLIVVGTGAALTVLETALQHGQKVAVVERAKFGGTCLNHGCIPTKVMVTAADALGGYFATALETNQRFANYGERL